MPGPIKIGRTSGESVDRPVAELSRATGVPLPFKVAVARAVHDAHAIERALPVAFGSGPRESFPGILRRR